VIPIKPVRLPRVKSPQGKVHIYANGDEDRTLCGRVWAPPDWEMLPPETQADCARCQRTVDTFRGWA
jgi:hypothetical protein